MQKRVMRPIGIPMTLVGRRTGQEGKHFEAKCPRCKQVVMCHRYYAMRVLTFCPHFRLCWDDGPIRGRVAVFWSRNFDPAIHQ